MQADVIFKEPPPLSYAPCIHYIYIGSAMYRTDIHLRCSPFDIEINVIQSNRTDV